MATLVTKGLGDSCSSLVIAGLGGPFFKYFRLQKKIGRGVMDISGAIERLPNKGVTQI